MQMVDVGCGIGGSSRHLARKYGCSAQGITLSPVQAKRAQQITDEAGLGDRCSPGHALHALPAGCRHSCLQLCTLGCTSGTCVLGRCRAARPKWLTAWPRPTLPSPTPPSGLRRVSFQVADALQQPFPDASFDLVWSLESGEHMPEKPRFVSELVRVCAPGGRVIIVTWCHR